MAIAASRRSFQRILGVPTLAGGWREFAVRFAVLQCGLMLFGFALVLGYRSSLGLNAWNIFQIALTNYIPIEFPKWVDGVLVRNADFGDDRTVLDALDHHPVLVDECVSRHDGAGHVLSVFVLRGG